MAALRRNSGLFACALLGLLAINCAQAEDAATGIQPFEDYGNHIRMAKGVAPLTDNAFGDQINLYNGATEFDATDVSLPGNNALPVQVSRRYTIDSRRGDPGYLGGFGEWDLEVPRIEATVTSTNGWTLNNGSSAYCSDTFDTLNTHISAPVGDVIAPLEMVWDGDQLHIPGAGDQELLVNNQSKSPAYASRGTYKWVTKGNWKVSCLGSVANPSSALSGEAFVALSPSGVSYTFNWAVVHIAPSVHIMDETFNGNPVSIFAPRERVFLLATKVQDRFGNAVTYTYDGNNHLTGITSSDGRSITLAWNGDNIASATSALGTWSYSYGTDINGRTTLTAVTRPDGSKWAYSNVSGSLVTTRNPECNQCQGDGVPPPATHCQLTPYSKLGTFIYSVTAPSGATATYDFDYERHYRFEVPFACEDSEPNDHYPEVFDFFDNFTITGKQITGPALPSMAWTYDTGGTYNDDTGWDGGYFHAAVPYDPNTLVYDPMSCAGTGVGRGYNVTVTGPTSIIKYSFGDNYGCDEGRLYGTAVGYKDASGNFVALKTTASNYVSDDQTDEADSEPFPNVMGQTQLGNFVHPANNRLRPIKLSQITQDGATFTSTVNSFDAFARAISTGEQGSFSKTVATLYYDDLTHWVLGQTASTAVNGTAGPCAAGDTSLMACTTYDSSTALPVNSYAFGKFVSTKAWNADGTLHTITDGNNHVTTLANWKRGVPQTVTYADGASQSAAVNDAGWITSVTDENGYTTSYAYDAMGRINAITYPLDSHVAWNNTSLSFAPYTAGAEYGIPAGHWKQTIQTGNAINNTYFDALWRPLVTETYDSANKAGTLSQTVKRYDAGGRAIFASYPLSNTALDYSTYNTGTHSSYDALDRVTQVQADSEKGLLTSTTQYLTGFKTQVTDPNGNATTTSYWTYGAPDTSQPYQIIAPQNETTTITRDVFGKPIWIARSGTTYEAFVYDGNQQLCKRIAMGIVTGYAYDAAGNLSWSASGLNENANANCDITQTLAGSHLVQRSYDARNRLTDLTFADGNGNQHWTYTPDGLPKEVTTNNAGVIATNAFTYDSRRLMTGESISVPNQFTWGMGYGYDANGNLVTRYTPSGQTYIYMPDALGRPTQLGIQNVNTYVYNVSYLPDQHIGQFTWTSGLTHTVSENTRGLTYEIHDQMQGNDAADLTYTYDGNGNPTQINDVATGARSATLAYDSLNRLTSVNLAASGPTATTYTYNTLDQITGTAQGTHTRSFGYGTSTGRPDELMSLTDSQTGTTSYSYDAQGNLATKNGVSYQFDYGNRLRNVVGQEGSYAYDAYGRRIQQVNTAGVINSFYDHAGQLVYQEDRDGTTHDYLYLQGRLVAIRDYNASGAATAMRYQHTDAEGSIIRQTDKTGAEIAGTGYIYDAWGKQIGGSVHDGPGYTGHVMDASTGLTYMQQRYYDPDAMHFLSMDPVEANNAGGNLDRYWYANDNPYRFTDPDGLYACGSKVSSSDCGKIDKFVDKINQSLKGLNKNSSDYKALSAVSQFLGTKGDNNGISIETAPLGKNVVAQAKDIKTIQLDMKKIGGNLTRYIEDNNHGVKDAGIIAGGTALAHETQHLIDANRPGYRDGPEGLPTTPGSEIATERRAWGVEGSYGRGLGGIDTGASTPAQVEEGAQNSLEKWCSEPGASCK